jgi:hypothetical protein
MAGELPEPYNGLTGNEANGMSDTISQHGGSQHGGSQHAGISFAGEANSAGNLKAQSERLRPEFEAPPEQWQRETRHLSQIAKKVLHPAYFRIIGMGEPVIPLLLEALRDRPAHWFTALRATANFDPVTPGSNPSAAREAWLKWRKSQGLID